MSHRIKARSFDRLRMTGWRGEATGLGCLPLPRSRAFWLCTTVEKALAHGRDRGNPRPLLKERGRTGRHGREAAAYLAGYS
jgi:hypothetical protein